MSPKTPPGQTREQIFHFVQKKLNEGMPPTIREVQEAFGFRSVQTAREHLDILAAEGRLIKQPGISRGLRLPSGPSAPGDFCSIPLLGRVQAGLPTVPFEEIEEYISVKAQSGEDLFALRVQGDSMKNAGILHGDIVIVRCRPDATDGDIVVALVGDEATVKRFRRKENAVALYPENPDFEPIFSPDIAIIGKVIEVRRILDETSLRKRSGLYG